MAVVSTALLGPFNLLILAVLLFEFLKIPINTTLAEFLVFTIYFHFIQKFTSLTGQLILLVLFFLLSSAYGLEPLVDGNFVPLLFISGFFAVIVFIV